MRITGLAAPWNTTSTRTARRGAYRFPPHSIRLPDDRAVDVVAGHKTTPHVVGRVVEFELTEVGLVVVEAHVDDDLDVDQLAFSVEVSPWEMIRDDQGVDVLVVSVLHRIALTRAPAFDGTAVHVLDEDQEPPQ